MGRALWPITCWSNRMTWSQYVVSRQEIIDRASHRKITELLPSSVYLVFVMVYYCCFLFVCDVDHQIKQHRGRLCLWKMTQSVNGVSRLFLAGLLAVKNLCLHADCDVNLVQESLVYMCSGWLIHHHQFTSFGSDIINLCFKHRNTLTSYGENDGELWIGHPTSQLLLKST